MSDKPKTINIDVLRDTVNEAESTLTVVWRIANNKDISDTGRLLALGVELDRMQKLVQRIKEELSKVET